MAITYFQNAGNTTDIGLYIPLAGLVGVDAAELAVGDAARQSKVVSGLLHTLCDKFLTGDIRIVSQKSNLISAGANLFNRTFSFTIRRFVNPIGIETIDIPSVDAFPAYDTWLDAFIPGSEVLTGGSVAIDPGVVVGGYVPSGSGLQFDEASSPYDSLYALLVYGIFNNSVVRASNVASAMISRSIGARSLATIPASYLESDAETEVGITLAQVAGGAALLNIPVSFTMQYVLDDDTQTFDVNHVTA